MRDLRPESHNIGLEMRCQTIQMKKLVRESRWMSFFSAASQDGAYHPNCLIGKFVLLESETFHAIPFSTGGFALH